jgi:hypothetical protein
MQQKIELVTRGIGIVFYSPFAMEGVPDGEDYFVSSFSKPADVAARLTSCAFGAFSVGEAGRFELVIDDGELDAQAVNGARFKLRFVLEVRDGVICFRDINDLMVWSAECPAEQTVSMADGFYSVIAYTSPPKSGVIGDGQRIDLNFEKGDRKLELAWRGVPQLC